MSRLVWDKTSERLYETGVKNCALYPWDDTIISYKEADPKPTENTFSNGEYYTRSGSGTKEDPYVYAKANSFTANTDYYVVDKKGAYGKGVAWNGITAVNETPTGAEATDLYADDMKYLSLLSAEELEGTIEAYMYPDEFEQCDGSATKDGITFGQQSRKQFCLAYITTVGNDVDNNDFGEKLHLLYNAKASPSERAYATINDSPEAITFSWSLKATKEKISDAMKTAVKAIGIDLKDTALITISKKDKKGDLTKHYDEIYNAVFGTDGENGEDGKDPKMLMPDDICKILTRTNSDG